MYRQSHAWFFPARLRQGDRIAGGSRKLSVAVSTQRPRLSGVQNTSLRTELPTARAGPGNRLLCKFPVVSRRGTNRPRVAARDKAAPLQLFTSPNPGVRSDGYCRYELHLCGDVIPVRIGGLLKLRKRLEGLSQLKNSNLRRL